jgi:sugar lactone lactonase YvrE
MALTLNDSSVSSMSVATKKGTFHSPLDSTPNLNGKIIYFTASNAHGSGVFQVTADGGMATEVFVGSPFVHPRGIAISPDGQMLYIADPGADQIFSLAVTGGKPSPLADSKGTMPQNLNVVMQDGQQVIYFTGKVPMSDEGAVLRLSVQGGSGVSVIAKGDPLVAPDGIVVTRTGIIYVADRMAAGSGAGEVFKLSGTTLTSVVDPVHLGNPAGIALSPDETILLASAFQRNSSHDEVLLVDLKSLHTGAVTKVVGQNTNDSGGLHASPGVRGVLSWCGVTVGGSGTVYRVNLS